MKGHTLPPFQIDGWSRLALDCPSNAKQFVKEMEFRGRKPVQDLALQKEIGLQNSLSRLFNLLLFEVFITRQVWPLLNIWIAVFRYFLSVN